ncbi:YicC/YloC family endoribonuclease [Metabacillus malikii]|uniref:Uncharacterized protein (TIGR00255 family) n=1 Tax=Metabacillus malikii TaxID=1504265 RepID=A0ABT9ZE90_9BACI|nr:YicC/YloC family endoribonuclease [Metabacillus malikii]MDQ0230592.1 uncharacterized protein (TIGR00255 family) [Metabacillus malikii]
MVFSMTGYGRASAEMSSSSMMTVEMKSVNHRFLDISIKIPKQYMILEEKIRKVINEHVKRGRVEIFVNLEGEALIEKSIHVDWTILDQYVETLHQIKDRFSLKDDLTLMNILKMNEVMEIRERPVKDETFETKLLNLVETAAIQLVNMRKAEGKLLSNDLTERLVLLKSLTNELETIAPLVTEQYREKIEKRITEYVKDTIDEQRILTEVAMFAEKADISEELTRIHSHIQQFEDTLQMKEPIGRKLDFLVQELNREANTIGSKANDRLIAKNVVEIKSLIEKLKEQVQNIE